jgi:hypothetical protein
MGKRTGKPAAIAVLVGGRDTSSSCLSAALTLFRGANTAQGSGPTQERLGDAEFKTLTDRRIEIVKFALQLTPDQSKYWPPVERRSAQSDGAPIAP